MTKERIENITEEIRRISREDGTNYKVEIRPSQKVNKACDAIIIGNGTVRPSIDTDQIDETKSDAENAKELYEMAQEAIRSNPFCEKDTIEMINRAIETGNIMACVVNTEKNKHIIDNLVHRDFLDLSIIYRVKLEKPDNATIAITESKAKELNMSEEMLFEQAIANRETVVQNLNEVIAEMFGVPSEEIKEANPMHVLSNKTKLYGAIAITDTDALAELADKMDSDLILLPSSIHEILAIPTGNGTPKDYATMVKEVNEDCVEKKDELSDHAYLFERSTKEVKMYQ